MYMYVKYMGSVGCVRLCLGPFLHQQNINLYLIIPAIEDACTVDGDCAGITGDVECRNDGSGDQCLCQTGHTGAAGATTCDPVGKSSCEVWWHSTRENSDDFITLDIGFEKKMCVRCFSPSDKDIMLRKTPISCSRSYFDDRTLPATTINFFCKQ